MAEQGHTHSQCRLGICSTSGQGVTQDDAEAAKWWRKAAKQGYEPAREILKKLEH